MHLLYGTKFPSQSSPDPPAKTHWLKLPPSVSTIPPLLSHSLFIAHQPTRFCSRRPTTPSSSNRSIYASKRTSQLTPTFTGLGSTRIRFTFRRIIPQLLCGLGTRMASPLAPISTRTTQYISSIVRLALMASSCSTLMGWTLSLRPVLSNTILSVAFLTSTSSLAARQTLLHSQGSTPRLSDCQQRFHIGPSVFINADLDTKVRFPHLFVNASVDVPGIGFVDVANVISKYAAANIPLETMWTDIGLSHFLTNLCSILNLSIDYMDRRRIFTVDPNYFPMPRMREIVSYLHAHQQKFSESTAACDDSTNKLTHFTVLMTDPAVPYQPNAGYPPYDHGHTLDVFLKANNGSESLGVVWPGR